MFFFPAGSNSSNDIPEGSDFPKMMIFLWAQRVHIYIFPVGSGSSNDIPAGSVGPYTMNKNISAGSAGYTVNKFARCAGL